MHFPKAIDVDLFKSFEISKGQRQYFSRNWPPLFPTTDTVSLTLGHGLKLCSLLAVVQIVELACLQLVFLLLLPLVFGLQSSAHDVALHGGTIWMVNLTRSVHCCIVGNVVRMLYGKDVGTINVLIGVFYL